MHNTPHIPRHRPALLRTEHHFALLPLLMAVCFVAFAYATSEPAPLSGSGLTVAPSPGEPLVGDIAAALNTDAANIDSVTASELPGLYEIIDASGEVLFVDRALQYAIQPGGGLYRLQGDAITSLTAVRLAARTKGIISAEQPITFPANDAERGQIYAFTDIHCTYCQRLHQMVPGLQAAGITVHYLPAPIFEQSREGMEAAWCATEPGNALTRLKAAAAMGEQAVATALSSIARHEDCQFNEKRALATMQRLGIQGTPTLFDQNGKSLPFTGSLDALVNAALAGRPAVVDP